MNGFALLWSKTLDSSLWINESKETRLVFVTLMMMKDSDGIVQSSVVGLANRARVTMAECKAALKVLLSPDKDDTSKVDNGRRIREVPGGWQLVNHDLYRFSTEAKREFWRTQKAEQRARAAGAMPELLDPGDESEESKLERITKVKTKIAIEEAAAEEVRKKFNPGYDQDKEKPKFKLKPGDTIKAYCGRQVYEKTPQKS